MKIQFRVFNYCFFVTGLGLFHPPFNFNVLRSFFKLPRLELERKECFLAVVRKKENMENGLNFVFLHVLQEDIDYSILYIITR